MLKRIPKSDISIRPFKAYKEWSFASGSAEISLLEANISSSELSNGVPKNSLYGQLNAQFYNGNEDNPFLRSGVKSNRYITAPLARERYLSGSAKVISIPNIYVGEGIKKGSLTLLDNKDLQNEITYIDDSFGNLQDDRDQINLSRVDIGENPISGAIHLPGLINFRDLAEYEYSASLLPINVVDTINTFDIENNIMTLKYKGVTYGLNLISMDIQSGVVIAKDIPFLPKESQGIKVGNVFYSQGLVVLTRDSAAKLMNDWVLDYKSTETIYENEFLLIVESDEFNVSQNPSAIVEVGKEVSYITGSDGKHYKTTPNTGVKYIRKLSTLETGEVLDYRYSGTTGSRKAGFEDYDLNASVDSTGSFLAPYITTIGLYDDNCDLIAVAKLPQPIKSEPDIPVNFIVRFDT
jgi:hypothetical protein